MKQFLACTMVVAIVLLALGQFAHGAEWNPTASDASVNTAGGDGALGLYNGWYNTAFGYCALHENDTGNYNTAFGHSAL